MLIKLTLREKENEIEIEIGVGASQQELCDKLIIKLYEY